MASGEQGKGVSPLTFLLGMVQGAVVALLLSLAPAPAYCFAGQLAVSPSDSGRGIARIYDPHGWLRHEERAALEGRLGEFWNRTGLPVSILIDSSSNSWESLESYTERTAKKWGLAGVPGQPGGLLLVVDPQMSKAALKVSAELAKEFPSGSLERIITAHVNPMLVQGHLAGGIALAFERIAATLEQSNRFNSSLFARGYGVLAAFGFFMAGMLLRRRWGPLRGAMVAALGFGTLVCFDGFTLGFPWLGVLFCAALSSFFLGLFVWVGMGNDPRDTAQQ